MVICTPPGYLDIPIAVEYKAMSRYNNTDIGNGYKIVTVGYCNPLVRLFKVSTCALGARRAP
jgi:hypothetical protein